MKKIIRALRKFVIGDSREESLSNYFTDIISRNLEKKVLDIIDLGSGFNPNLMILTSKNLKNLGYDVNLFCFDYYSQLQINELEKKFPMVTFKNLETYSLKKRFDLGIISDVLHHIGVEDKNVMIETINNLTKKTNLILIKDHFEYSYMSRQILRFMDFIGNYKDSVDIPKRYFNVNHFEELINESKITEIDRVLNIKIYNKFMFPFNKSKYQFIKLFRKK